MLIRTIEKVLVLAPHTDDAELGCGGTIARFLQEGVEVSVAAFSTAVDSLPPGMPESQLREEFLSAMAVMGLPSQRVKVFNYPVRKLSYHRQEVLEDLIRLRREISPDLVLLPSGTDLHQDHQVLHNEGLRAFKDLSVWGYELPWNHISFVANAFVTLERSHLDKKWEVLQKYKSQIQLERPYFTEEFIFSLARIRGVQVKSNYAEAFEVMRIKV